MEKIIFTDKQIREIQFDYEINGLSCEVIGKKIGLSRNPITTLLKKLDK